jgi:hypothetical protein
MSPLQEINFSKEREWENMPLLRILQSNIMDNRRQEILKRINRLMDELQEWGVDASITLWTWMEGDETQSTYSKVGNEYAIVGMLHEYLEQNNELDRMGAYPFLDESDE